MKRIVYLLVMTMTLSGCYYGPMGYGYHGYHGGYYGGGGGYYGYSQSRYYYH